MYSESVIKIIKDINQLERQLITDFGVDEPVRLVNTEFQKRFQLAQTKYNLSLSFPDKSRDLEKMASMMLRAWKSLQEQLLKEGVMPLPVDTWKLKHKETDREVFICKNEAGKKNVQKQFGKYAIVLSADELLNMIDHEIFLEFVKLTKQGLLPKITSYSPKADKNKTINNTRENINRFEFVRGRKSKHDEIMLFAGLAVKFEDVAKMCLFFMKNEDNLYPQSQGYKGAELFKKYIYDVLETRQIPDDKKYDIKKNKLTKITTNGDIHD